MEIFSAIVMVCTATTKFIFVMASFFPSVKEYLEHLYYLFKILPTNTWDIFCLFYKQIAVIVHQWIWKMFKWGGKKWVNTLFCFRLYKKISNSVWMLYFLCTGHCQDVTQYPKISWSYVSSSAEMNCSHNKGFTYIQTYWHIQRPGKTMTFILSKLLGGKIEYGDISEAKYLASKKKLWHWDSHCETLAV